MTTPVQPSTVHVNDVDLAYVAQGRGDPVILVHGSLGDYRSWRAQLAPFAAQYRAVAYSRRYHWPNKQPGDGAAYAVARHAADLGTFIESLGPAPVHVVGSSYGALTALTLAVARPDLVRSLVLGEPPLLPWLAQLSDGRALVEAFMASSFGPAAQAFARDEAEAGVRLFLDGVLGAGAFDRLPEEARKAMLDNATEMRVETMTPPEQYFPALSTEEVGQLQRPTLLVQGAVSPPMFGLISDELARCLPRGTGHAPGCLAQHARPELSCVQRRRARLPDHVLNHRDAVVARRQRLRDAGRPGGRMPGVHRGPVCIRPVLGGHAACWRRPAQGVA